MTLHDNRKNNPREEEVLCDMIEAVYYIYKQELQLLTDMPKHIFSFTVYFMSDVLCNKLRKTLLLPGPSTFETC